MSEVFAAALELPAAERGAWLAGRLDIDDSIRREVASLLDASEQAGPEQPRGLPLRIAEARRREQP